MRLLINEQALSQLAVLKQRGVYIVHGPRGVGKTTIVREFLDTDQPQIMKPQDGSIKLEQVHHVTRQLRLRSGDGTVFIIDDADTMSLHAQNAFLKTLEEIPSYGTIVLVAEQLGKLLPTIQSRSQSIYIAPPTQAAFKQWLQDRFDGTPLNLDEIATLSQGLPVLALKLAEDTEVYDAQSTQQQQIARLFHEDRYEALEAAQELQTDLPEVMDAIITYIRRQIRATSAAVAWVDYLAAAERALKLQAAHVNKRSVLDSIVLAGGRGW